ncbi:uncharacterized protein LOC128922140 [Zeugodacus cucurbitae]|uniref:uncharacterized protein LOC128922140 n=1 Tax=Zeugodacus cucurbitae TaxID=28588 RepID=UPI0023D9379D|nr:uncharacterized protein LOC128922140 [Zeugodacus cucurbitae]
MSAAQPHQQSRRHSLNAYFSFVEPTKTTPANKKSNGGDESSQRSAELESKQRTQSAEAEVNSNRATTNALTATSMQVPASTQITKEKKKEGENTQCKKGPSIQTGIDRYINTKRKSSPIKSAVNNKNFQAGTPNGKKPDILIGNRFALVSKERNDDAKGTTAAVNAKPPPIYLREHSSNVLVSNLSLQQGKSV